MKDGVFMNKNLSRFMCGILAASVTLVSMPFVQIYADDGEVKTDSQGRIVNSQRNSFDFIKENMPDEPELRFKGNTVDEYEIWQSSTKEKLKSVMGITDLTKANSEPKLLEQKVCNGYTRYKYEINTTSNLYMPYYVLSPVHPNGKAVIAIHGHGSDGKEGLVGNETEAYKNNVENKYHYSYALDMAEKGYTVYVPDLLGAGERTLGIYKDTTAECNDINNALTSLGYSLQGIILFENMLLTDYISTLNYSEIDCIGFSGGGQSALWLAVMSSKIDKTVVSGFLHSYADTLIYNNRCGCNFIPNMWKYVDMGDIAALAADKEIYFETGDKDSLNGDRGLDGVYEQIEIANKCFRLFDKEVQMNVCDGGHQWYGSWLDKF